MTAGRAGFHVTPIAAVMTSPIPLFVCGTGTSAGHRLASSRCSPGTAIRWQADARGHARLFVTVTEGIRHLIRQLAGLANGTRI